eukprot:CAMPEP_0184366234 /NCGR_PEP_ID=MMETSP1089-20130417/152767_1 /TAXON_ID=38269 ORGANISM="Gloeochaete wittrockiana, Strain SAG46.84" /NCGR_SAMPLE_ID=MMETSP1089 /ASSEMBLY_ACC=CAM_ASM_000445 /LENGTH=128 /DNA_ID=CAMNT_0026707745 /DNA_START=73 /DNA_END=456 /DNA_ORIENTATION=+
MDLFDIPSEVIDASVLTDPTKVVILSDPTTPLTKDETTSLNSNGTNVGQEEEIEVQITLPIKPPPPHFTLSKKLTICKKWKSGQCKRKNCWYSHGEEEFQAHANQLNQNGSSKSPCLDLRDLVARKKA